MRCTEVRTSEIQPEQLTSCLTILPNSDSAINIKGQGHLLIQSFGAPKYLPLKTVLIMKVNICLDIDSYDDTLVSSKKKKKKNKYLYLQVEENTKLVQ